MTSGRVAVLSSKQLAAVDVRQLPRIGEKQAKQLKKLGIQTLFDLLYYLPRRYEDRRITPSLSALKSGDLATVRGIITGIEEHSLRDNLTLQRVVMECGSLEVTAIWFNQGFLKRVLRPGSLLTVTGKVKKNLFGFEITVSDYEVGNPRFPVHTGRIVPVYSITENLSQRAFRRLMFDCLRSYVRRVMDSLPLELKEFYDLPSLPEALFQVHFPRNFESLEKARERLAFEELFLFQSGLLMIQEEVRNEGVSRIPVTDLPRRFLDSLPFSLTSAQLRVLKEIEQDLASPRRMYRLLQGDVGCGKTVVALYALFYTVAAGYQGAFMAPTEVLAEQHFLSLHRYSKPLGVRVGLLTGSLSKKEREEQLEKLRTGEIDIVVGTHALLQDDVVFHNLGLVVIDEQHRFGVRQRDLLLQKSTTADVLVMTATPIPRSLTLTVYGDLDLSVIAEMPPERKEVKTYYLPSEQKVRVYQFLRKELKAGRQVYVVCPLIEESEKLELEAAVRRAEELKAEFPEYQVGLLHGKMRIEEKERVMEAFRNGEVQILVSTSVIEVGIDVPNASVMVIEGAERFGLAQLHQLRGRVGRGASQGYCLLIGNPQTEEARQRIKALLKYSDGFKIAEEDLRLRGPGELLGTRQHGFSDFRVVDIFRDARLLPKTREAALKYRDKLNRQLLEEIDFRFPALKNGIKC